MPNRPSIRTWTDAYLALKSHLEAQRGFVEINTTPEEVERWPRTTGTDVVFVAAFVDHAFVRAPSIFGSESMRRRWRACMRDLERDAWNEPHQSYAENRAFWSTLRGICVHLDATGAEVPDGAFWAGVFVELDAGRGAAMRNASAVERGPFVTFDVATYDDMYIAQYRYLREHRGSDMLGPPDETIAGESLGGGTFAIPRTTNRDVLQLAAYWTHALADARSVLDSHDHVERAWSEVLRDVDTLAKGADPDATFARNNVLWRVLDDVSTQVSVAAQAPSRWDMLVHAFEHSIDHLPENLAKEVEWLGGHAKNVVVDVASTAGEAANKALKGLVSGATTPLLVGGGVLAAFLLLRNRDHVTEGGA